MNICIFEDFFISRLQPLNHLRHTSKIICGAYTLFEKVINYYPGKAKFCLHSRNYMAAYMEEKFPGMKINSFDGEDYVFLNSRGLFNRNILKKINKIFKDEKNAALVNGNNIIAFNVTSDRIPAVRQIVSRENNLFTFEDISALSLKIIEHSDVKLINYPSDPVLFLGEELNYDLERIIKGKKKLYVSKKAKIAKNVVFDTSAGKVYIDKNAVIEPFSFIKGPVYIGENCTIRAGSLIYGPVRIGLGSKVSGEITNSILHWYVNKQHLGFLGHSYLCEWVNLGAGTNTSNLKNNYSNISINVGGNKVDTNSIFLGSIIGDHTKTGINTMLNTGSLIGISCNVYGSGYHKNHIKSFTWDNASKGSEIVYEFTKALQTARISMKRRNVELTEEYEKMFRYVYDKKADSGI